MLDIFASNFSLSALTKLARRSIYLNFQIETTYEITEIKFKRFFDIKANSPESLDDLLIYGLLNEIIKTNSKFDSLTINDYKDIVNMSKEYFETDYGYLDLKDEIESIAISILSKRNLE